MRVVYHPKVQRDLNHILRYYDRANPKVGDAFWEELMGLVECARMNPEKYRRYKGELRRVNLERFPYHFLYRLVPGGIRVTIVRHNRRHPAFGITRR